MLNLINFMLLSGNNPHTWAFHSVLYKPSVFNNLHVPGLEQFSLIEYNMRSISAT